MNEKDHKKLQLLGKKIIGKEKSVYRRFYRGFEYWIIRPDTNPIFFHLCGYVVIDKESQYYISDNYNDYDINCHGGLTFADPLPQFSIEFAIGFDCGHLGDLSNSFQIEDGKDHNKEYRNVDYVDQECKRIINQLMK